MEEEVRHYQIYWTIDKKYKRKLFKFDLSNKKKPFCVVNITGNNYCNTLVCGERGFEYVMGVFIVLPKFYRLHGDTSRNCLASHLPIINPICSKGGRLGERAGYANSAISKEIRIVERCVASCGLALSC
ncbi:hypothetical protein TNCV_2604021 [Trichonephila clavipes]|nr:hypothetical protein TNCV_2604021 [Trichonephila clavipes]